MRRKVELNQKAPGFMAPRDPALRAELSKKRREAWPHPIGTWVAFRRNPDCVTATASLAFYRAKDGTIAVYVDKSPTSETKTMVATSRLRVLK